MPTRVDVAAEAAQNEVSSAIEQIENNLASESQSAPPSLDVTNNLPSPLFRDEVHQQEMRYLDSLLSGKKPAASSENKQLESKGLEEGKLGSGSGHSPRQVQPTHRSKIASILSPYDRRDDEDDAQNKPPQRNIEATSLHSPKNGTKTTRSSSQEQKQSPVKTPNRPKQNNQRSNLFGHKIHATISNIIHRRQQKSQKSKGGRYQKGTRTTATPSRNKRHQLNNKLIQRAERSSRRVITKIVRLGRSCTQRFTTLKGVIHQNVKKAMDDVHSMLEEELRCRNGLANGRRGYGL